MTAVIINVTKSFSTRGIKINQQVLETDTRVRDLATLIQINRFDQNSAFISEENQYDSQPFFSAL